MENFTPLKPAEKKKRKFNKFLIFGNLFLVILVAAIGIFYYNKTLIPIQQKANPVWCEDVTWDNTALGGCQNVCEGTNCCLKEKQCDISGNGFCGTPSGNQCDDDQWCLMDDSTCPGGGGGGLTCPNGQPPTCETPEVTTCVRPAACPIPNKILVDRGFCGEDPPKITCQTNCTCDTTVTSTPTPTPTLVVTRITTTPIPTICVPITEVACIDSCGQIRQCISDGCGGQLCCPATSPCPSVTPTPTGIITPSNTPTPTRTPTPTPTTPPGQPTNTPAPTATNTPGPSATPTPTNVPGVPTATPTEIILAKTTVTSPPVPVTGMVQSFMFLIPALIMFIGLLL